jgi:hypothetical protein
MKQVNTATTALHLALMVKPKRFEELVRAGGPERFVREVAEQAAAPFSKRGFQAMWNARPAQRALI